MIIKSLLLSYSRKLEKTKKFKSSSSYVINNLLADQSLMTSIK